MLIQIQSKIHIDCSGYLFFLFSISEFIRSCSLCFLVSVSSLSSSNYVYLSLIYASLGSSFKAYNFYMVYSYGHWLKNSAENYFFIFNFFCFDIQIIFIRTFQFARLLILSIPYSEKTTISPMFQDLTSLIVSIGTYSSKIGYGGDDAPKIMTPSYVGSSTNAMIPQQINAGSSKPNKYIIGSKFSSNFSGNMEVNSIFNINTAAKSSEDTYEIDFDKYESFIEENLKQTMHVNLKDYSVLLTEDITTKNQELRQNRSKIAEILFEKLKVPNIYFCKNPVLSCFATGRSTALVLDSGQNFTRSVAIHDGYALLKSVKCFGIGGKDISMQIEKSIGKTTGKAVQTRFQLAEAEKGKFPASFLSFQRKELMKDIKEHLSVKSNDENIEEVSTIEYQLPDHKIITLDKNQILDPFISPALFFKNSLSRPQKIFDVSYKGFPQMVIDSINSCDVDIKKQLFSNLLMTGGNLLYANLMKQVEYKVNEFAPPNAKVKTVATCTPAERKYTEWIGGSIVTSLSSFQSYWIGEQEWKQNGASIIEKKCP